MMKETNFGPLLLLLLLAVTHRNSCANPIASPEGMMDGADADMSSIIAKKEEIANDMEKGADILTKAMTWLKDNAVHSQFDKSIHDFKAKLLKLPQRLAEYRGEILTGLEISQDRLQQLRTLLHLAATTLKGHCNKVLGFYKGNVSDLTTLQYSSEKFVDFAKEVNVILQLALKTTIEINDRLSASKAFLNDFKAVLDEEKNDIEAAPGGIPPVNGSEQYTAEVTMLLCTFGLTPHCKITITFTNKKMQAKAVADRKLSNYITNDQDKQREGMELLNGIKPAYKSATTLLSHVEIVKTYLSEETKLITIWQSYLRGAISENTNVSSNDIKYNIDGIINSLNVLIKACDAYIAHEFPEILEG